MPCLSLLLPLLWLASVSAAAPEFVEDAAAMVKAEFRSRGSRTDYQQIVVEWQPASLVVSPKDIDYSQQRVEMQVEDGAWSGLEESPVMKRGKYRATFEVAPCKSHHFRLVMSSLSGEEATYHYPPAVGPAPQENILASRFTPRAPTQVEVEELGNNQVRVSWQPVDCATNYEVYGSAGNSIPVITGTTGETSIVLEGAGSCASYEIIVTAYTGDEASEETIRDLTTAPGPDAALKLEVSVNSSIDSVAASWDGWAQLSCVASYQVSVCREGDCSEVTTVQKPEFGGLSMFGSGELKECSDYTLKVKPLFDGQELSPKLVEFRTLSPAITGVEQYLGEISALAGEEQMVSISWSAVKCAASYEVFQKQEQEGSVWELMESVREPGLVIKGVPCTEYSYGVRVTIDDQQSDMVEAASLVTIPLDNSVPYHPAGLEKVVLETGVELTWDHASCITSYRLSLCKEGDCQDKEVSVDEPAQHTVSLTVDTLEPCSDYTMKIFATNNGEELDAEEQKFTTLSPPASAPSDLTSSLQSSTGKIDVSFSPVQCASGYKIHQALDEGPLAVVVDTTSTDTNLPALPPCSTFSIGVSSIVAGEESEVSQLEEGRVPPETSSSPGLVITSAANTTVHFFVSTPTLNTKCLVVEYEVKYQSLDAMVEQETRTLQPSEEEDASLTIEEFPGAADKGMRLEARIKYADGVFSPWVSSREPTTVDPTDEESNSLMVPIVIGLLLGVVVLAVVIFFIVKKKQSQNKYDPESAQNDEESKQLKESNPEA